MPHKCPEQKLAYAKAYYEAHKEEILAKDKVYREAHKEKISAQNLAYREANKDKIRDQRKVYREANKEEILARNRAYHKSNRESLLVKQRTYRKDNLDKIKAQYRKRKYGLADEQYQALLLSQNGFCAICRKLSKRSLHVDHNHETKSIRGILCNGCNTALGLFDDNLDALRRAIAYLEANNE